MEKRDNKLVIIEVGGGSARSKAFFLIRCKGCPKTYTWLIGNLDIKKPTTICPHCGHINRAVVIFDPNPNRYNL